MLLDLLQKRQPEASLDTIHKRFVAHHALGGVNHTYDIGAKLIDFTTSATTEAGAHDLYALTTANYILYRMYDYDLKRNPFLCYFVNQYVEWQSSGTSVDRILNYILCNVNNIGSETVQSLKPVEHKINWNEIQSYLIDQWFSQAEVERLKTPAIVWIYEHSDDPGKFDKDRDLDDIVMHQSLERLAQYSTLDLERFTNPFNKTSVQIFNFMLSYDVNSQTRAINALIRTKATNLSVDMLHQVLVNGKLADRSMTALLVYEFVQFNLSGGQAVSPSTVRLLCLMLLSLVKNHCLEPLQDYYLLFSSMLSFVGKAPEAQQVYALTRDRNGVDGSTM